jgi:hypothetical protein
VLTQDPVSAATRACMLSLQPTIRHVCWRTKYDSIKCYEVNCRRFLVTSARAFSQLRNTVEHSRMTRRLSSVFGTDEQLRHARSIHLEVRGAR